METRSLWDYEEEDKASPGGDVESLTHEESDKIEHTRREILSSVTQSRPVLLRDRVAWVLNHYPRTRDSDIELQIEYWRHFDEGVGSRDYITLEQYRDLTRLTSIARYRAKIQNEYRLFQASEEVRRHRGALQTGHQDESIEDKPDLLAYSVAFDESGKTDEHLVVGSVWFLESRFLLTLARRVDKLRERLGGSMEFHFRNIRDHNRDTYIELIDYLFEDSNSVSFKLISSSQRGVKNKNELLQHLCYRLLREGVEHEHRTGRAPLPRELSVWKDAEEEEFDSLFLSKLKTDLERDSATRFGGDLHLGRFEALDSAEHWAMQIADLWSSCVSRVLNSAPGIHAKDAVAGYFMSKMGVASLGDLETDSEGTAVVRFALGG